MAGMSDVEIQSDDWVMNADDAIIACRGQGHNWPKIRPGRKQKKGVNIDPSPERDGSYYIMVTCADCGKRRYTVTLPSGMLDLPARYSYIDPEGYKAPKGVPVTRRQCLAESWRRLYEQLTAASDDGT
jgi:hypothetical protein